MTTPSTVPPEVQLALGRLFAMMTRPEQPGDADQFHEIRAIVMDSCEQRADYRPNWARDRLTGAAGD